MSDVQHAADLQRIHDSEVYGAAVFGTAAWLTRDAVRKGTWRTLKALEDQTLARYLAFMRTTGRPVKHPWVWVLWGHLEGAALGLMPWRLAMRLLARGTRPFQETFRRLEEHAEGEQRAFFAYVYAHEKAIEAFALGELAGDPRSLEGVEGLLGR